MDYLINVSVVAPKKKKKKKKKNTSIMTVSMGRYRKYDKQTHELIKTHFYNIPTLTVTSLSFDPISVFVTKQYFLIL